MKRDFVRLLALVFAIVAGEGPQFVQAGQPSKNGNQLVGGNFQVADGLKNKPIHLDVAANNGLQTLNFPQSGRNTGGDSNKNSDHPPLVRKTPGDNKPDSGKNIDVGKLGVITSDPKLGGVSKNHLNVDLNKNLGKMPIDPNVGKGIKAKIPLVKIDPGVNFHCGNGGTKCVPWKPWNPWCNPKLGWYPCWPIFDPCDPCCHWHPIITIIYIDCPPVYVCDPLYVVQPIVVEEGVARPDLVLEDLRLVDNGDAAQGLGPCYRMLVTNKSEVDVTDKFQVALLATLGDAPTDKSPRGQSYIEGLAAGKSTIVDLRLPVESLAMGESADGHKLAFSKLQAMVDSRRQIPETNETNNAAAFARDKVALVKPTVFGCDDPVTSKGGELVVMGEGFGDESGQVYLIAGGLKLKAQTTGWMSNGIRVTLPELDGAADLKVMVVRADGETSEAAGLPMQVAQQ